MSTAVYRRLAWMSAVVVWGLFTSPAPGDEFLAEGDDLAALRARMDAYEAELSQLRAAQSDKPTGQFASLAEEALAEDEGACGHGCKLEKVDIVTKPTYKIIGRIYCDHLMIDQDDLHRDTFGDGKNRTRFDTFRIGVEGLVYENVEYKLEIAFGENGPGTDRPDAKDVYLQLTELAYLGHVRVGHFKEPFSLEEMTSNRFTTFMERSLLNTFVPSRNIGIMAFDSFRQDELLSWYTGVFRAEMSDDAPDRSEDSSDWAWTSRVAWNPYYDEPSEGRYLVHLGASYSYRAIGDNTVSFAHDPGLNIANLNVVNLPNANVDDLHLLLAEAAWSNGPFHVQAEWCHARLNGQTGPDGDFDAAFVQVGYFLTGEHRGYRKTYHAFDRVKVYEPFFCVRTCDGVCKGAGAWEVKARWGYIDLNDGTLIGGRVQDFSTGVNWYLNSYCRVMFDYVHSISESQPRVVGGDVSVPGADGGEANVFGMRAQIDW